jgi:hypothetical protein
MAIAALPFTLIAASCDDDGDGNIDNPDLNPGDGTGVDLDPGSGSGVPGTAVDDG